MSILTKSWRRHHGVEVKERLKKWVFRRFVWKLAVMWPTWRDVLRQCTAAGKRGDRTKARLPIVEMRVRLMMTSNGEEILRGYDWATQSCMFIQRYWAGVQFSAGKNRLCVYPCSSLEKEATVIPSRSGWQQKQMNFVDADNVSTSTLPSPPFSLRLQGDVKMLLYTCTVHTRAHIYNAYIRKLVRCSVYY